MRFSPCVLLAAIIALEVFNPECFAQNSAQEVERMRARRDLELAKAELRHYWLIEYPRQRRQISATIELTEDEIRDYKARINAYRPYERYSVGQPFLITMQDLRMCLREAELRLRNLWAERNALARLHSADWRYLEMQVHEARLRVAELETDDGNLSDGDEPLSQLF